MLAWAMQTKKQEQHKPTSELGQYAAQRRVWVGGNGTVPYGEMVNLKNYRIRVSQVNGE